MSVIAIWFFFSPHNNYHMSVKWVQTLASPLMVVWFGTMNLLVSITIVFSCSKTCITRVFAVLTILECGVWQPEVHSQCCATATAPCFQSSCIILNRKPAPTKPQLLLSPPLILWQHLFYFLALNLSILGASCKWNHMCAFVSDSFHLA